MPNVNVGSPLYMSPQALKHSKYSDKSDIWAIGVTAYELLFGHVPWQAGSEKELANKISTVAVRFPPSVSVSNDCYDFIKRCLIVDESLRIGVDQMQSH
jgi:SNF-related kinase